MTDDDIKAEIIQLSGSGKRVAPGARKNGIYSSFTIHPLSDLKAVRNTMQRFVDSGVPLDLRGKTVIDVGSNVGAVALEFASRGATVTGVEYREDRVALCNVMAIKYGLDACFHQADFNALRGDEPWMGKFDFVWCSSVDEYITDLEPFYDMLHVMCADTLYLESNLQGAGLSDPWNMLAILERAGFVETTYLGNGHSGGVSRKRKLYRAKVAS